MRDIGTLRYILCSNINIYVFLYVHRERIMYRCGFGLGLVQTTKVAGTLWCRMSMDDLLPALFR